MQTALLVWAWSPVAPQMSQTSLRRMGQVTVRPSFVFRLCELGRKGLSCGRSLKTNLNRKQKIEIGNASYRNCEGSDLKTSSPSPFLWQSTQCLISLPFILTILASR